MRRYNNHRYDVDKNQPRKSVSLKEAFGSVQDLVASLETSDERKFNHDQQDKVLRRVKGALGTVLTGVENGALNPSGKHGKEISQFFEFVLYAYSKLRIPGISLFDESQVVLTTLENWNLDIRSRHYENAIVLANRENRFKEAADLFLRQIDPEAGYNPVNVSIAKPHGLYAIARTAQEEGALPPERVFDAVVKLTMVSPSDQDRYILAAGTALGCTGEWKSAIKHLQMSSEAGKVGQPLTASVMQACLLSNRPDAALEAFDYSIDKQIFAGGEWQWGGERERIDPLCRDLAMRAMKGKSGMSSLALDLFQQALNENLCISIAAVQGVVEACEHDQNLEGALSVFLETLQNRNNKRWIVDPLDLSIREVSDNKLSNSDDGSIWESNSGRLLASVMRTCNLTENFGVALWCAELVNLSSETKNQGSKLEYCTTAANIGSIGAPLTSNGEVCCDILVAMMMSLCGLRCYRSAVDICELTTGPSKSNIGKESKLSSDAVRRVHEYAESENMKLGTIRLGNPWISGSSCIQRLATSLQVLKKGGGHASVELSSVCDDLAASMKACTYVHQSALSLILFWWVKEQLYGKSFEFPVIDKAKISQAAFVDNFAMKSDFLFAEVINAHRWSGNVTGSIDLFESLLATSFGEMERWGLSCTAGLSALVANGQGDAALEVFIALDQATLNQDTYILIGNYLAKEKRWAELRDIYRTALEEGYESEELTLSTMKAVVSSDVESRIIVLRTMVDDIATHNGMRPKDWLRSRYWTLRRSIGFKYARLLMWWNNPDTCHLDELDFAIQEFSELTAAGRKVRYDTIRSILVSARKGVAKEVVSNYDWVPSSIREWSGLMEAVVEELQSSELLTPRMIDDVVMSYLALGCVEECVDFVNVMLSKGARVNRKSLVEALNIARILPGEEKAINLEMMLGP